MSSPARSNPSSTRTDEALAWLERKLPKKHATLQALKGQAGKGGKAKEEYDRAVRSVVVAFERRVRENEPIETDEAVVLTGSRIGEDVAVAKYRSPRNIEGLPTYYEAELLRLKELVDAGYMDEVRAVNRIKRLIPGAHLAIVQPTAITSGE